MCNLHYRFRYNAITPLLLARPCYAMPCHAMPCHAYAYMRTYKYILLDSLCHILHACLLCFHSLSIQSNAPPPLPPPTHTHAHAHARCGPQHQWCLSTVRLVYSPALSCPALPHMVVSSDAKRVHLISCCPCLPTPHSGTGDVLIQPPSHSDALM